MSSLANRVVRQGQRPVWHLINAKDQVVGRLATQIASIVKGKHKPTWSPNVVCGDYVVVINARNVVFTGKKEKRKLYQWHTGYPGGLRQRTPEQQRERAPEEILRRAVHGMLPKNRLRREMMDLVKVYEGPVHPHMEELGGKSCLLSGGAGENST